MAACQQAKFNATQLQRNEWKAQLLKTSGLRLLEPEGVAKENYGLHKIFWFKYTFYKI